jgi:hypothetical protein
MTKPVYAQTISTTAAQGSNSYIYVPLNNATGKVAVVDLTQATPIISTISVGANPIACVVTPDGKYCYTVCSGGELDCIDTSTNLLVWKYTLPAGTYVDMCITPDGAYLYVIGNRIPSGTGFVISEIRLSDRNAFNLNVNPSALFSGVNSVSASSNTVYMGFQFSSGSPASSIYNWTIPIRTYPAAVWLVFTQTGSLILGASPDDNYLAVGVNGRSALELRQKNGVLVGNMPGNSIASIVWSSDSQVVYWGDATILRWTAIQIPQDVAGQLLLSEPGDGMVIDDTGATLLYVSTTYGGAFPIDTFKHTAGSAVTLSSNPKKPGAMLQPLGVAQNLPIVQVGNGQTWNVTLSTSAPTTGSGTYILYSGSRLIARASVGQNIGPFTAYDGETISLAVSGTASGFTASVSGVAYERGEQVPIVFPGISG